MDKFNKNMKSKTLEDILSTYKNKSNKDLSNILVSLKLDFDKTKSIVLEFTEVLAELEKTYDVIYDELQNRLKFKDDNESGI
jgi:hypothetical protein